MPIWHPLRSLEQRGTGQGDLDILRLSSFELGTPDQGTLDTPAGHPSAAEPARPARGRKRADDAEPRTKVDRVVVVSGRLSGTDRVYVAGQLVSL